MSLVNKQITLTFLVAFAVFVSAAASSILTENPLFLKLLAAILPLFLYAIYMLKGDGAVLNFQRTIIPRYLLWILPWFVCISIYFRMPISSLPELGFLFFVIAECLIGAMTEELMFRGVLFRVFQKSKFPIYLLVSSLTFGLLHFSGGISDIGQATIIGLGYGLARLSGCPLFVLIICHTLTNFPKHVVVYNDLPVEVLTIMSERLENTSYVSWIYLSIILAVVCMYLFIPKHWSKHLNRTGVTMTFIGKKIEI